MSEKLVAPDLRRAAAELARRIGILERRIATPSAATGTPANDDIIFSYAGELVDGTESPPAKLRYGGFLSTVAVALGTAGSSTTTLELHRNGILAATITVGSGTADLVADVGLRVAAEDKISLVVDTAGTGAAAMTAAARFT